MNFSGKFTVSALQKKNWKIGGCPTVASIYKLSNLSCFLTHALVAKFSYVS